MNQQHDRPPRCTSCALIRGPLAIRDLQLDFLTIDVFGHAHTLHPGRHARHVACAALTLHDRTHEQREQISDQQDDLPSLQASQVLTSWLDLTGRPQTTLAHA
jgi:hypothetical protein